MDGLIGVLSEPSGLSGTLSPPQQMHGTVSPVTDYPVYGGSCEVTPGGDVQVLETRNRLLRTDIVVNPIPSNYGLITWNGSVLLVS